MVELAALTCSQDLVVWGRYSGVPDQLTAGSGARPALQVSKANITPLPLCYVALMDAVNLLADVLDAADQHLQFTIFEVGARAVNKAEEPFYRLLSIFPGSRIIAFEPDEELCAQKNATGREGLVHYPFALGRREEQRPFYETEHPMCSSLYQPNESLLEKYNNLEVMRIRRIGKVDTVSIDHFVESEGIECIDFIKIDIQGAELEVFQGGVSSLSNVLAVVTEAEFIQLYVDQPLF